ncbi:ArsR family transcriptional regulator [Glutamicibacter mysorens]|uniref:ArsR family transcriptional regulator n=1 Tax=Glutamicibacter mysorens TaxID=257984 RepID=A0ABX4MZF2_9MICC|nr:TIGR03086 family metal-binding protein [Glutamicibacter mysorens]PJJ44964.1 ArsR family transcriptional regulator [Glutamicibacter mysorens]
MSFERTVILPVDADTAFELVTDPERLRRWQTVACRMDLRVGGSYRFTMGPGHHAAGTVTEIEPGKRLVLTWGWEGSDAVPPGDSTLYITMEPHAEGTALTLRHEGLDAGQSSGHAEGWNHFLDRLVRFAQTGHAVPDEWNATPEPADAITAAEASLAALQLVLHHLQEKDLQRPTPCTEFNVSQLVDHLAGNLALACKALGSEQADDPSLEAEPRIAQLAQAALESFSARGLEGTLDLGFAVVPASVLSGILNLEFMVHGWDFAQATNQEFDVDPGLAEYVLELARATVGEQQRASGSFGPETAIAESAGSLERLIAFTGRVPAGA